MAADRNINPDQLKMFMTPDEIKAQYSILPGDRWEGEANEEFWRRKDADNAKPGWDRGPGSAPLADVDLTTISNPVRLVERGRWGSPPYIGNGHHRVAAGVQDTVEGAELYLPVVHYDNQLQAARDGQYQTYGNYDRNGRRLNWTD